MQSKTRRKNSKKRRIGRVLQKSEAPEEPMPKHWCIQWLSEDPTPYASVQFGVPTDPSKEISVALVEPTRPSQASVQSTYYCPEMMSRAQEPRLQHRLNR